MTELRACRRAPPHFELFLPTIANTRRGVYNKEVKHEEKRYSSTNGGRRGLKGSRFYPLLRILACLVLLAAGIGALWHFGLPFARSLFAGEPDFSCLGIKPSASPSPTATAEPSPTPVLGAEHRLYGVDLAAEQTELVLAAYQYVTDFSVGEGKLVLAAGNYTQDGTAAFTRVVLYDLSTGVSEYLSPPLQYKSIRYPCLSEDYLVYLDATADGGGRVMAYSRTDGTSRLLKTVHAGLPRLSLYAHYVCFTERTGSSRDKLFLIDVATGESVTLCIYDNSSFGLSAPCMADGLLVYADNTGKLIRLDLSSGKSSALDTGLYVHDPKTVGGNVAFISGNHGYDSDLYYLPAGENMPRLVATGVVDFAMGNGFLAYSVDEKTYIWFADDEATFCITRGEEKSQLLAAGGDYCVWMDVSWRDKDIPEFMRVTD